MELALYKPRDANVYAVQVTRQNAEEVAKQFGGAVSKDTKPGDPTDEATWISVPTLAGVAKLLVTHEGPVVGRESDTNQTVVWESLRDFNEKYGKVGVR